MKYFSLLIFTTLVILVGCFNKKTDDTEFPAASKDVIAEAFINAFYSFDRDSLQSLLTEAVSSQSSILYYQAWAECGNYEVKNRGKFYEENDSLVISPITVKDDLIGALNIGFNVTDTFHITIVNGSIKKVDTSSNDPEEYYAAKKWVNENRPELIEIPCEGIWKDGPTPCECVQGMVQGFKEMMLTVESSEG